MDRTALVRSRYCHRDEAVVCGARPAAKDQLLERERLVLTCNCRFKEVTAHDRMTDAFERVSFFRLLGFHIHERWGDPVEIGCS